MPQNNGNPFNALANAIARITRAANSGNAGQAAARGARGLNASPNRQVQQGGGGERRGGGVSFLSPDQVQGISQSTGPQGSMFSFSQLDANGYGAGGGNAERTPAEKALFDNPLAYQQMQMDAAELQENGSDEPSYEYKRTTISHPVSGQPKTPDSWGQVYYNEDGDKFAESTDADTDTTTTRFRPSPDGTGGPNVRDVLSKNGLMDSAMSNGSSGSNGGQTPNANKEVWSRNPGVIPDVTALGVPLDNPNVSQFNRAMEGLAGVARGATPREVALSAGTPLPTLAGALNGLDLLFGIDQAHATTGEDETSSGETENANPSGARTSGHAKATTAPSSANDIYGGVETRNTDVEANEALYQDAARVLNSAPKEAQNSMLPPGVTAPATTGTTNLYPGSDLLRNAYQAGDISLEEYQDAIGELTANRDAERETGNETSQSSSGSGTGASGSEKADTDMSAEDFQNAGAGEGGTAVDPVTGQPIIGSGAGELADWNAFLLDHPEYAERYGDIMDFKINGDAGDWYTWVMDPRIIQHYSDVDPNWSPEEFENEWFNKNEAMDIASLMARNGEEDFYRYMGYDPAIWGMLYNMGLEGDGTLNYGAALGVPNVAEATPEEIAKLIAAEKAMAAYGMLQSGDTHGWSLDDWNSIYNPLGYEVGTGEGYSYDDGTDYLNVDPNKVSFGNWWEAGPAGDYLVGLPDESYLNAVYDQSTLNDNWGNESAYNYTGLPTSYTTQALSSAGLGLKKLNS